LLPVVSLFGFLSSSKEARSARTFCSSVHVIEHVSAQLILFNIEPDTLNIDPNKIEEALKSAIRAILPVHLYGHPCEMNTVSKLALNYELAAIDDSILELSA
jgi:dTDP-4-amino-4,6-dideoxygalactose transaminase